MHVFSPASRSLWLKIGVVLLVTLAIDQISKAFVKTNFPNLMQFNTGISFGWLAINPFIINILLLLVLAGLLRMHWHSTFRGKPILIGIFLGGVLSNMLDRVLWGGVWDWLPIPFTVLKNNFADWCIVSALVVLLIEELEVIGKKKPLQLLPKEEK